MKQIRSVRVSDLGERAVIERIRQRSGGRERGVILGIGDDASVVRGPAKLLLTTDMLVEDCDFRKASFPPFLLGRKSLCVNLSDIAAMGGKPLHAVVGMALPGDTDQLWLDRFLAGFRAAAAEYGVALVGGDLSQAPKIMISVTVTGEAGKFVTRAGAKPGDVIYVSGTLGDAAGGLRLLESGRRPAMRGREARLFRAFLDPAPRLELGAALARRAIASAMIDISDGLAVDLTHICEESGVRAEIDLAKIPISGGLLLAVDNPLDLALNGGEDFELLFTVKKKNAAAVERLSRRFPLTAIGRIVRGKGIAAQYPDGRGRPLEAKGWEHFRP
jgi:thiamine-monophosphate kinase